ncbi:hypothetical protein A28LD_1941 [Idiomarina sp. A28L]|uniref:PepSY-associated TM helix domain-containing protein n=1 Tax=Idiomarina sp. A28L TaxID=1036674 RepID=UPI00021388DA|nr:PepSY-associated TM helix domain-containing protein [Idiomarina sp. A28L]EGN74924.1 hypothetical protein A28LD_1941 [Idiomarina sp. A28L]
MGRLSPFARSEGYINSTQQSWLQKSLSISVLSSLHRRAGLILFIQVIIWTVSGFYFSWQGREALTASRYMHTLPAKPLSVMESYITPDMQLERLGDVRSVSVKLIDDRPHIEAYYVPSLDLGHETHPSTRNIHRNAVAWFDGETGHRWQTSAIMAQRLAVNSYTGSGMFNGIKDIHRSADFPGWAGPGFEVEFADNLNTRVYIDQASGTVLGHRNDPWKIADWMYRLHFMDYSGNRNFNNLLIIAAGLFSLWFVLTGIIMLVRVWRQGAFVARASLPYNTALRSKRIPANMMASDNDSNESTTKTLESKNSELQESASQEQVQQELEQQKTEQNTSVQGESESTEERKEDPDEDNNPPKVEPKN